MGKGQKINDRLKELILIELATNENCSEVSRIFGVAESTVRKIRDEEPDKYAELRDQKKETTHRRSCPMEKRVYETCRSKYK